MPERLNVHLLWCWTRPGSSSVFGVFGAANGFVDDASPHVLSPSSFFVNLSVDHMALHPDEEVLRSGRTDDCVESMRVLSFFYDDIGLVRGLLHGLMLQGRMEEARRELHRHGPKPAVNEAVDLPFLYEAAHLEEWEFLAREAEMESERRYVHPPGEPLESAEEPEDAVAENEKKARRARLMLLRALINELAERPEPARQAALELRVPLPAAVCDEDGTWRIPEPTAWRLRYALVERLLAFDTGGAVQMALAHGDLRSAAVLLQLQGQYRLAELTDMARSWSTPSPRPVVRVLRALSAGEDCGEELRALSQMALPPPPDAGEASFGPPRTARAHRTASQLIHRAAAELAGREPAQDLPELTHWDQTGEELLEPLGGVFHGSDDLFGDPRPRDLPPGAFRVETWLGDAEGAERTRRVADLLAGECEREVLESLCLAALRRAFAEAPAGKPLATPGGVFGEAEWVDQYEQGQYIYDQIEEFCRRHGFECVWDGEALASPDGWLKDAEGPAPFELREYAPRREPPHFALVNRLLNDIAHAAGPDEQADLYDAVDVVAAAPVQGPEYQKACKRLRDGVFDWPVAEDDEVGGRSNSNGPPSRNVGFRRLMLAGAVRGDLAVVRQALADLEELDRLTDEDIAACAGMIAVTVSPEAAIAMVQDRLKSAPAPADTAEVDEGLGLRFMLAAFQAQRGDEGAAKRRSELLERLRQQGSLRDLHLIGAGAWSDYERLSLRPQALMHYMGMGSCDAPRGADVFGNDDEAMSVIQSLYANISGDYAMARGIHAQRLVSLFDEKYQLYAYLEARALYETACLLDDLQRGAETAPEARCARIMQNAGGLQNVVYMLVTGLKQVGRGDLADRIASDALGRLESCARLQHPSDMFYLDSESYAEELERLSRLLGQTFVPKPSAPRTGGFWSAEGHDFENGFCGHTGKLTIGEFGRVTSLGWPQRVTSLGFAVRQAWLQGEPARGLALAAQYILVQLARDGEIGHSRDLVEWAILLNRAARHDAGVE